MLKDLSKDELLKVMRAYDNYIQEFFEIEEHEGMIPVCLNEFYNNEYSYYEENIIEDDTFSSYERELEYDYLENEYLKQKFRQEFIADRVIDEIMDLCDNRKINKFMRKEFRENVDLEEFRSIFSDLRDDEFIEFMNNILGFVLEDIEDYNRRCL